MGVRSFILVFVDESDVSSGKVAEKFIIEETTAIAALDGVKDVTVAVVLGCVEHLLSGGIYNYRPVHRFGPCSTTGKVRVVLRSDTCGGWRPIFGVSASQWRTFVENNNHLLWFLYVTH